MGIWLLIYSIADEHLDRYLDWFHHTHIDEKLARPGYNWATHYRVQGEGNRYIAMFGSSSSRTFFDPSPKQLKPKQDALTREMIGYRMQPMSLVCTCEWSNSTDQSHTIQSRFIELSLFGNDSDDQDVMAWCAQQHSPSRESDFIVHQFLASSGAPRHLSIVEAHKVTGKLVQLQAGDDKESPAANRYIAEQILFRD